MKTENASLIMNYWDNIPLEVLHQHSQQWLSEIAFWKEEFTFMQKLIKNHFLYFTDPKRMQKTNRLKKTLSELENDLKTLEVNVRDHESHLSIFMLSKTEKREREYRNEHDSLEQLLNNFTKNFKSSKRLLFEEADEVLKEEKMQRLINMAG